MTKRILSLVVLGISLLTACNKTDNEYEPVVGNELAFKVNEISDTKGTPISSFADGSKAGVYGYLTPNGGSAPTTADVMKNQELTLDGTSWNYSPAKEWSDDVEDVYNFYAYYPYIDGTTKNTTGVKPSNVKGELSINYKVPTTCINQPDLMIAKATVNSKSEAVKLDFKHALSTVSFKVKGDPSKVITKITVSNIFTQGNLTYGESGVEWKTAGKRTTIKYNAKINNSVTPSDEIQNLTTSDGYLMMVPQVIPNAGITVNITIDGKSKALKITKDMVENGKWEANKQYSYVINAQDIVDFDKSFFDNFPNVANCYIVQKGSEITIPINEYISYFWTNYGANPTEKGWANLSADQLTANVIWTEKGTVANTATAISIDDVTPGSGTMTKDLVTNGTTDFTASTTTIGLKFKVSNTYKYNNFTIGVKKAGSANYLWSWHIWVTDYNPYITSGQKEVTYDDVTNTWMDRNLGAYSTEYVPEYGLGTIYYQWGRKDPIPAETSTPTVGYTASVANIADAVKVPDKFYLTNNEDYGDWCITTSIWDQDRGYHWRDNKLATVDETAVNYNPDKRYDTRKSIFDPSPLGWMVPGSTNPTKHVSPFTFTENCQAYNYDQGIIASEVLFPITGTRNCYDGLPTHNVSSTQRGYYCSASAASDNVSCNLYFYRSVTRLDYFVSNAYGYSVRSIKQE